MTDFNVQESALPTRSLLRPERFAGFRGEIEDVTTAQRIASGQPWRVRELAERTDALYEAARRFSNAVFSGGHAPFEELSDAMDNAHHALYEWAKNEHRLEAWHAEGGGLGDE